LFTQDPVLFLKVIEGILLPLVHPASREISRNRNGSTRRRWREVHILLGSICRVSATLIMSLSFVFWTNCRPLFHCPVCPDSPSTNRTHRLPAFDNRPILGDYALSPLDDPKPWPRIEVRNHPRTAQTHQRANPK
jgi:hypothetical protein